MTLEFVPPIQGTEDAKKQKERGTFGIGYLHFHKSTSSFSCEVSDSPIKNLRTWCNTDPIFVKNNANGKIITFKFTHQDTDGEGEVFGWNYKAVRGHSFPCTLLIIND